MPDCVLMLSQLNLLISAGEFWRCLAEEHGQKKIIRFTLSLSIYKNQPPSPMSRDQFNSDVDALEKHDEDGALAKLGWVVGGKGAFAKGSSEHGVPPYRPFDNQSFAVYPRSHCFKITTNSNMRAIGSLPGVKAIVEERMRLTRKLCLNFLLPIPVYGCCVSGTQG